MTNSGRFTPRHGMRNSAEYNAWRSMKKRCLLPQCPAFAFYGGSGVTIHAEWITSFEDFFAYVGLRPSPAHSLDRFPNPKGNYEPGNVRWATDEQQNQNRGDYNILVPFNGSMVTVSEWAKVTGGNAHLVYERIKRGWEPGRALSLARNASRVGQRRSEATKLKQSEARRAWHERNSSHLRIK